jgi:3-dehydroquinate synthase
VSSPTSLPTRRTVSVSLGERSYEIVISQDILNSSGEIIQTWLESRFGSGGSLSACLVTDANVRQHADIVENSLTSRNFRITRFDMEPGERSKRLEVISAIWDQLIEFQADRRTVVVAVGGGVVGDAAGFAAASFARGIPFVQVPTTLLADVDSSVGGKVGINHPKAKNMIGAFHQPLGVLIDSHVLNTLPDREFRAGLAEVVKYGVILDEEFFRFLEQNAEAINQRDPESVNYAIARSCELKAQVVEEDEFERTGLRAILNYGHTFAHAFEALTGYGELLHGEAVAIGMLYASRLAELRNMIPPEVTHRQRELMARLNLTLSLPNPGALSSKAVLQRMALDKKTVGGQLRFILPIRIGEVTLVKDVSPQQVRDVLREGGIL